MRKQTRRAETQVSKPRELSEEIKCTIYINLVIVDHLREKIYDERVYIYINYIDIYMNPLEEKRPRIRPLDVARARLPKSTLHTHTHTNTRTHEYARAHSALISQDKWRQKKSLKQTKNKYKKLKKNTYISTYIYAY